eukprot:1800691-Prymnesium_polylepis.1
MPSILVAPAARIASCARFATARIRRSAGRLMSAARGWHIMAMSTSQPCSTAKPEMVLPKGRSITDTPTAASARVSVSHVAVTVWRWSAELEATTRQIARSMSCTSVHYL